MMDVSEHSDADDNYQISEYITNLRILEIVIKKFQNGEIVKFKLMNKLSPLSTVRTYNLYLPLL